MVLPSKEVRTTKPRIIFLCCGIVYYYITYTQYYNINNTITSTVINSVTIKQYCIKWNWKILCEVYLLFIYRLIFLSGNTKRGLISRLCRENINIDNCILSPGQHPNNFVVISVIIPDYQDWRWPHPSTTLEIIVHATEITSSGRLLSENEN